MSAPDDVERSAGREGNDEPAPAGSDTRAADCAAAFVAGIEASNAAAADGEQQASNDSGGCRLQGGNLSKFGAGSP